MKNFNDYGKYLELLGIDKKFDYEIDMVKDLEHELMTDFN